MKNEERYFDEKTGIEYRLVGDYYIPNLILDEQKDITLNKYGRLRLDYLKNHKKDEYAILLLENKLINHLEEIQEISLNRIENIINSLKNKNNLTEEMKDTDQLYWVGMMNNFKIQAEEIVLRELIYI